MQTGEPSPGEAWAYRARQADRLVEVVVMKIGSRRPIRVLVQFVDPSFEGLEEWVPPARLKVPWVEVEAFEAKERRWAAVLAPFREDDEPEADAAGIVFERLIPEGVARVWDYHADGVVAIDDVAGLAQLLGLDPVELHDPLSFVEDGHLIVPWPLTRRIAIRAARRTPDPIMQYVEHEEADARHEATYGRVYRQRGGPTHIEPEICISIDEEHGAPVRGILRSWCGAEAVDRWDELRELRLEVLRLGELVQAAADELRRHDARREADDIVQRLGIPVETLRGR
jgi:hypothetical protein